MTDLNQFLEEKQKPRVKTVSFSMTDEEAKEVSEVRAMCRNKLDDHQFASRVFRHYIKQALRDIQEMLKG